LPKTALCWEFLRFRPANAPLVCEATGTKERYPDCRDIPYNDNPNYIIQVGNVFGFIISIENVL